MTIRADTSLSSAQIGIYLFARGGSGSVFIVCIENDSRKSCGRHSHIPAMAVGMPSTRTMRQRTGLMSLNLIGSAVVA